MSRADARRWMAVVNGYIRDLFDRRYVERRRSDRRRAFAGARWILAIDRRLEERRIADRRRHG